MPTTLIPDIARGNMASLKFKRDLADMEHKVAKEKLHALTSNLSALQSLLRRFEEV